MRYRRLLRLGYSPAASLNGRFNVLDPHRAGALRASTSAGVKRLWGFRGHVSNGFFSGMRSPLYPPTLGGACLSRGGSFGRLSFAVNGLGVLGLYSLAKRSYRSLLSRLSASGGLVVTLNS